MKAPTITEPGLEVRDLPETLTAAVRVVRTPDDLSAAFPELLPRIADRVAELGGEIEGPPYARYHAVTATAFDVEIGAPVAAPVAGLTALDDLPAGEVGASSLPGGRAAIALHIGPYSELGVTWRRTDFLLAERGFVARAPGWEWYVDDPDLVAPEAMRTEIVIPLD